jgi:hypothetical protein
MGRRHLVRKSSTNEMRVIGSNPPTGRHYFRFPRDATGATDVEELVTSGEQLLLRQPGLYTLRLRSYSYRNAVAGSTQVARRPSKANTLGADKEFPKNLSHGVALIRTFGPDGRLTGKFDSSNWAFAHGLILSTIPSGVKSVLQWSVGIVKRCEIDPMPCSNCLNLVDPLLSDESSSLRERLEPVFQSKSHAFE